MKMDGQIRVKTEGRHKRLYNDLTISVFEDNHDLFFVCACLGYKQNKRKSISGARDDRFWSKTINPREWTCYYAMVLEQNDMDYRCIQDDSSVISIIEEYANAGIEILLDDFLSKYTTKTGYELQIDGSVSTELAKDLLHFLYDQIDLDVT